MLSFKQKIALMAQRERPDVKFHGIVVEAVPRTFKWLQEVHSRNQLANGVVEIYNAAIWSQPTKLWVDRFENVLLNLLLIIFV
jgi:hypothetical protein